MLLFFLQLYSLQLLMTISALGFLNLVIYFQNLCLIMSYHLILISPSEKVPEMQIL